MGDQEAQGRCDLNGELRSSKAQSQPEREKPNAASRTPQASKKPELQAPLMLSASHPRTVQDFFTSGLDWQAIWAPTHYNPIPFRWLDGRRRSDGRTTHNVEHLYIWPFRPFLWQTWFKLWLAADPLHCLISLPITWIQWLLERIRIVKGNKSVM